MEAELLTVDRVADDMGKGRGCRNFLGGHYLPHALRYLLRWVGCDPTFMIDNRNRNHATTTLTIIKKGQKRQALMRLEIAVTACFVFALGSARAKHIIRYQVVPVRLAMQYILTQETRPRVRLFSGSCVMGTATQRLKSVSPQAVG